MCWPAFGRILVLVAAFSCSTFNWKSIEKNDFPSFWQDLGFGGCVLLFYFLKVFTNCFFQLLLGCWFWRLLFPAHLLKKCFYTQTYFISWGCG